MDGEVTPSTLSTLSQVKCEVCSLDQRFLKVREVEGQWWEMEAEETGFRGIVSRHHFHPVEAGEGSPPAWHLGTLERGEAEHLLSTPANSQGSWLVRRSPHTHGLVLSVKTYDDATEEFLCRHYPVPKLPDATDTETLEELLGSLRPGLLGPPCILPNPTADAALVRSWELESTPDAWMIPR